MRSFWKCLGPWQFATRGLCLGTCWSGRRSDGKIRYGKIRFSRSTVFGLAAYPYLFRTSVRVQKESPAAGSATRTNTGSSNENGLVLVMSRGVLPGFCRWWPYAVRRCLRHGGMHAVVVRGDLAIRRPRAGSRFHK
eukprot:scaffold38791_cov19-Prasinocladus_malaysianus.AAC.4